MKGLYTVDEICTQYRQAKNKMEMIQILADCQTTGVNDIIDILREHGFNVRHIKRVKRSYRFDIQLALELYNEGYFDNEIAHQCGVSSNTITNWRSKMKLKSNYIIQRRQKLNDKCNVFMGLYEQGFSDPKIAELTGAKVSLVTSWRYKNNLAANGRWKRRKEEKDENKKDKDI